MDELNTVADVLRHGAALVEADWWNGQHTRSKTSHCALTSVDLTSQETIAFLGFECRQRILDLGFETRRYMQRQVEQMGYTYDPDQGTKAFVAIWNDEQADGGVVAKQMRIWADQWEAEHA